jgi:protein SCO1/2
MTRTILALLAVAASGCEPAPETSAAEADPLPYYASAEFTPHWFDAPADVPGDFHAVPAFALTDQESRTVTEADLDGKVTVANFFFTACPGICPATTANMLRVQREFLNELPNIDFPQRC